jgi:hypothetical protein
MDIKPWQALSHPRARSGTANLRKYFREYFELGWSDRMRLARPMSVPCRRVVDDEIPWNEP